MELEDWETTRDLNPIYADVRALGLEQCIAEHDAYGFTVIPPEKIAPPEFHERLRVALLSLFERRTGQHIDPSEIETSTFGGDQPIARNWAIIGEDPVFEQALMNPVVHTMARYFLGKSVLLSEINGLIKRRDPRPSHLLHTDQHGAPPPLPQYLQTLNITWTLTDYSREKGSVALVPGSHRYGRIPRAYEADHLKPDAPVKAIPINCKAGSLIIWGGTTWHGTYPRTVDGVRMTLIFVFSRGYMKQIRDMRHEIGREVLERNPPEFARLIGMAKAFPLGADGGAADQARVAELMHAGSNPWG